MQILLGMGRSSGIMERGSVVEFRSSRSGFLAVLVYLETKHDEASETLTFQAWEESCQCVARVMCICNICESKMFSAQLVKTLSFSAPTSLRGWWHWDGIVTSGCRKSQWGID